MHQLNIANEWYRSNGMLVNPTKHQDMIIGNTNHVFYFPVHESVALFGITVDNRLCFDEHISNIAFHTPKLKINSMILWKEFLVLKEKASLLQIMVCSGAMSFNCVWLQLIFCSYANNTALFSFLRSLLRENGRYLLKNKLVDRMMEQLSNPIIAVFSRRSIMICSPLIKSPYFAQLRPIIVLTI